MTVAPRLERGGLRLPQPVLTAAGNVLRNWFIPFAIAFVIVYPMIVVLAVGFGGAGRWIDNFGIQILIYVMLGWGLNIVVGLAGLLDLGYVAFYPVGPYSYPLLPTPSPLPFWL